MWHGRYGARLQVAVEHEVSIAHEQRDSVERSGSRLGPRRRRFRRRAQRLDSGAHVRPVRRDLELGAVLQYVCDGRHLARGDSGGLVLSDRPRLPARRRRSDVPRRVGHAAAAACLRMAKPLHARQCEQRSNGHPTRVIEKLLDHVAVGRSVHARKVPLHLCVGKPGRAWLGGLPCAHPLRLHYLPPRPCRRMPHRRADLLKECHPAYEATQGGAPTASARRAIGHACTRCGWR